MRAGVPEDGEYSTSRQAGEDGPGGQEPDQQRGAARGGQQPGGQVRPTGLTRVREISSAEGEERAANGHAQEQQSGAGPPTRKCRE